MTISLLGIILLLILSNILEPSLQSINTLEIKDLNKKTKIQGQIINIKNYETFRIITIDDKTKSINVIINKPNKHLNLTKGQNLTIIGKINQYKNTLQIQAERIIIPYTQS